MVGQVKPVFEFLREDLYLQGFMSLRTEDYRGPQGDFDFQPKEPVVTRIDVSYLTPRGLHLTLSQGGICLAERVLEGEGLIDPGELRGPTEGGRIKMTELNIKMRGVINLEKDSQLRMDVRRLRFGKIPYIIFGWEINNGYFKGEMKGTLEPGPVPQTNANILRN